MKSVPPPNLSRRVTFYLLICSLAFQILTPGASAQGEPRRNIDWIFVLDTSKSMIGADGSKNIFGDVKRTLVNFVGKTSDGDSVTLYTFANETDTTRGTQLISGDQDRRNLSEKINAIQADGTRTHTGEALQKAFELAGRLRKNPGADARTISIVLLSDGKEDTRGLSNVVSIPSNLKLIPEDPPYLFYVSLGEPEPAIDDIGKQMGPGRYEKATPDNPQEIFETIERIRQAAQKPPPPPPPQEIRLSLNPSALDFGQVEPGEQTKGVSVQLGSNVKTRVRLALENAQGDALALAEPREVVDLDADETSTVEVRLAAAPGLADGSYSARLVLSPVDAPPDAKVQTASSDASLGVARVPVWRKAIKWVLIALAALLLLLVALSLLKGEPPWIWLAEIFSSGNKNIEGEIEVIKPQAAGDVYVNLAERKARSLPLSTLVPDGATANADAELYAERRNGQKTMWLRRTRGDVQVNKIEVAMTELFDGDVIELGDARLRFNWVGHERPPDPDENI